MKMEQKKKKTLNCTKTSSKSPIRPKIAIVFLLTLPTQVDARGLTLLYDRNK